MEWNERVKAEYEEIIRKRDNTHRHNSWINDLQLNTITLNELPQVNCIELVGDADNYADIVQRAFPDSVPRTFSWIPLTQNVFFEGEKEMDDVKDNSFMDDTIFFELVQALMEKYGNEMEQNTQTLPFPSPIIFEAINFNFPSKHTPQMLKEKYIQHQHQESLQSITSIVNHNNTESVSHHSITDSEKYFCRSCLTYGCLLNHQGEMRTRSNLQKQRYSITEPEPCSSACFRHLEASGITVNSTMAGIQITSNTISVWTEEDHIYFRMVRRMYCNNSCLIAEAMRTINCKEVYEYAQKDVKLDIHEAFQDYTPRPDPLPRKRMNRVQWSKFHHKLPKIDSGGRYFNYKPCDHEGECNKDNPSCCCAQAPTFCEKFCKCSSTCKYRFMGCSCKAKCKPKECACAWASRECDPELCKSCGAHQIEPRQNSCKNVSLQRKKYKALLVAPSQVAGWGLYITESAEKDELISEYCGELISHAEADRRGEIYEERKCSYLFTLDSKFVVDATSVGSEIRFVNHSEQPNIYAKVKMVAGDHHVGIFANRAIIAGEELYLNYNSSAEKFPGIEK